ncbi:amidohydrolase family protein [Diaminobutyricibacter tongyongensis]|uniref:Amidohydrolase family protein n=1 Tax=Leifsonia tongyongensis TaxID=1268043 RepID=A0A6L9XZ77_9MICO|nr:amidohydrolase family protein [Diaminobutyricibacter tongyongensis]NEN06575.1 amidohydrolase family protein [Diaminobutyricibacter tongyongensis]
MSLALRGARLPGHDGLVDLLVEDGRIASIAPAAHEAAEPPAGAEPLAVDGRWVVPGLWDNHVHFTQWARTSRRLDVSDAESAAHAARLVEVTAPARDDEVLVGFGYHSARWPDEPTRELLDRAAGGRPVVLIAGDLHACWLSTSAAGRFAPDSVAAVLCEDESFAVITALESRDEPDLDAWALEAGRQAAARGVVGIVDLEMAWNLDVWLRRIEAGHDSLRIDFGTYTQDLGRAIELGLRTGEVIDGSSGLLSVGPFKVITDGSLNTRTAFCFDPYPDSGASEHPFGVLTVPTDELIELMTIASEAGLEPAVHAIGDHANHLALDAFERVGCTGRIEHAQLLATDDIARFARLGVTASVQPEHAMDDRDAADALWAGRTGRAFPLAALHRAGARLAFGSDAPVAPLDPWASIASAVARSRGARAPWHPANAVSREVALTASARSSVAVGEVADLAVVERDPLACTLGELRRMPVAATLLGGRFTHTTLH